MNRKRPGMDGRGDLVLLPWEIGFLTWKLNEIPLKPCKIKELMSELQTLAQKYDKNPELVFLGSRGPPTSRDDSREFRRAMPQPSPTSTPYPGNTEQIILVPLIAQ